MDVKDIIALMKAVSENGLTKFELEQGDMKLVMGRDKKSAAAGAALPDRKEPADRIQDTETAGNVITCPLVGTFYSSPSPEAENFVKIGDRVKKGQVLGIVEAMKLMNEIESEYDGVVEEILVENESVVEYGQPLFKIR